MVDPILSGGVVGALWAAKNLLGPTVQQVADDIRSFYLRVSDRRLASIRSFSARAEERYAALPERPTSAPDALVIRTVVEQNSWRDDDVSQEYVAGLILQAAHAPDGIGLADYYLRMTAGLTTDELRLHHLVYFTVLQNSEMIGWTENASAGGVRVLLPRKDVDRVLVQPERLEETLDALIRDRLLGDVDVSDRASGEAEAVMGLPGFSVRLGSMGANLFNAVYAINGGLAGLLGARDTPVLNPRLPQASDARVYFREPSLEDFDRMMKHFPNF